MRELFLPRSERHDGYPTVAQDRDCANTPGNVGQKPLGNLKIGDLNWDYEALTPRQVLQAQSGHNVIAPAFGESPANTFPRLWHRKTQTPWLALNLHEMPATQDPIFDEPGRSSSLVVLLALELISLTAYAYVKAQNMLSKTLRRSEVSKSPFEAGWELAPDIYVGGGRTHPA
ncbi:hypothetical protein AK812_SmicGene1319 [Symbiodinium microadriaticum]|uniref:Uncharacterized protein n=1 Tax=Symbiodinium microadriaticum TaxID=2951 RepID=A0A1Q9F4K2_SYMMI|nr:hypothetical protein AK812_SmicGene1319 [Symbiodinium microadriaticum]